MNSMDISGKKILFFSPAFFNYENIIADKMREMGAEVDMYDVRSVTRAFDRALLKISLNFFEKRSRLYYDKIIDQSINKKYDYILIVKCDMTPVCVLERLKKENPNAKLCLYLWDSVANVPGIVDKFKYFDTLHSFDLNDCDNYPNLAFRPLFFADQYISDNSDIKEYKYDISFIGTIHSDRYAVIKKIQQIADEKKLMCYWFLYLQSKFIFYFYKITKKEFRKVKKSNFCFKKMSADDIVGVVKNSKIVLDVHHPKQTGLTMRTIEMIGMNKKLITTNINILKYDFFNSENVVVVDRNKVEIPDDFLKNAYTPLPTEVYEKYSLKRWILDVLD